MVGVDDGGGWQDGTNHRAQAAFQAVADDRVADLLSYGEADPYPRVIITTTNEENEAGGRGTLAGVGGDEVLARCEDGEG